MMDHPHSRTAAIIFAMVLATLVANTALTYLNLLRIDHNSKEVAHTHEVLISLKTLLTTVVNAETGQRGYLITEKDSYLAPYDDAVRGAHEEVAHLRELTADNRDQQSDVGRLEAFVQQRLKQIEDTLVKARDEGFEKSRQAIATTGGKKTMGEIRDVLSRLEKRERDLLSIRQADTRVSFVTATVTILFMALLGGAMVVVGYAMVKRDLARRVALAETMSKHVEELEDRVTQRTREITEANQFLQQEVTERREAEARAQQFSEELQRSNQELEHFASIASHDLQEPLRKIQAFGDRLKEKSRDALDTQAGDYLDRMLASATRMRSLINDLLAYSRVSTRQRSYSQVDLRQTALDVVGDLEVRLHQTGGIVEIGDLPTIEADPLQMRQLFQNLIGNGLKFQQPGIPPKVQVTARTPDRPPSLAPDSPVGWYCEITVADNGIGFEQVYVDRIFQLFQRLHGRDDYEGTGMGLAICRKIVDLHGGEITAYSAPGQGARFVFTLPVRQNSTGAVA